MNAKTAMQYIRASRSDPPGRASESPLRRETYTAALEQFEQLRTAAQAVSSAARPLPLFYSLSQAGRAIVAAHGGDDFSIDHHGLSEHRYSGKQKPPTDLLHRKIKRVPSEHDAFGAVCRAVGAPDITGEVELGAVWASMPLVTGPPDESWRKAWRPAVLVDRQRENPQYAKLLPAGLNFTSDLGHVSVDIEKGLVRRHYPQLPTGMRIQGAHNKSINRPHRWVGFAHGKDAFVFFHSVPYVTVGRDERALIPKLSGQKEPMTPLMAWWLLLFGLSVLARYHPALWLEALSVDSHPTAVRLESLMEEAIEQVPPLIYAALLPEAMDRTW